MIIVRQKKVGSINIVMTSSEEDNCTWTVRTSYDKQLLRSYEHGSSMEAEYTFNTIYDTLIDRMHFDA
jgi:hypothetical protein